MASDFLPLEFQLLVETLQIYSKNDEETKSVQEKLKKLDINLKIISKKYIYSIIKGEIYKGLLEYPPPRLTYPKPIDGRSFKILNHNLAKYSKSYHNFSKWFIEAIQSDLWEISSSELFHKKDRYTKIQGRKMKKELELIRPWYELITSVSGKEFNDRLHQHLVDILDRIVFYIDTFVKFSSFRFEKYTPPLEGEFDHFSWHDSAMVVDVQNKKDDDKYSFEDYQEKKRVEAEKLLEMLEIDKLSDQKKMWIPQEGKRPIDLFDEILDKDEQPVEGNDPQMDLKRPEVPKAETSKVEATDKDEWIPQD